MKSSGIEKRKNRRFTKKIIKWTEITVEPCYKLWLTDVNEKVMIELLLNVS